LCFWYNNVKRKFKCSSDSLTGANLASIVIIFFKLKGNICVSIIYNIFFILNRFQEVFSKKKNAERNAEASTHLLCPTPTGPKYNAAVKWKLPVVSKDWLLACAEQGIRVAEEPYLIAGSTITKTSAGNYSDHSLFNELYQVASGKKIFSTKNNIVTRKIVIVI
jgi:hypothetical protein